MNWLQLALVIICTPLLICSAWWTVALIVDALRGDRDDLPRCACGSRIVRDRNPIVRDDSDLTVHTRALCQPYREWVDD